MQKGGDTVTVTAFGYYAQPVQHGFFFTLGSFLAGLFQPAQAPPPSFEARKRQDLPLLQVGVAAGLASLPQLGNGVPKGYLRVLVFDKDSALVSQQTQQLSQAAGGGYEPLTQRVVLPQDGYVSAYVGNESDVDVLFDDVQVEHRPGLQVQENSYDPWGLNLAGLDYATPGLLGLNKYQFNGKERQLDLGLGWSDYGARFYDNQVPHWITLDPLAEKMRRWSPYVFSFNNPLRFLDPDGRKPTPRQAAEIANDVYDPSGKTLRGGWHASGLKTGLSYSNTATGFKSNLYERTKHGKTEYTYATAGTNDKPDVKTDVVQTFSGNDAQYKQSTDNARSLVKGLEGRELTFTGHSLGGGLASANALATGNDAITFNAAAVSDATKGVLGLNQRAAIDSYVIDGELVTYSQGAIGMQAEGTSHILSTDYGLARYPVSEAIIRNNPFATTIEQLYILYQRTANHLMGTVIQKMDEQGVK